MYLLCTTDPFLAAAKHQEGLNIVVIEVGVPLPAKARLHLIVSV